MTGEHPAKICAFCQQPVSDPVRYRGECFHFTDCFLEARPAKDGECRECGTELGAGYFCDSCEP